MITTVKPNKNGYAPKNKTQKENYESSVPYLTSCNKTQKHFQRARKTHFQVPKH